MQLFLISVHHFRYAYAINFLSAAVRCSVLLISRV